MLRKLSLLAVCIGVLSSQSVFAETTNPDKEGRAKSWRKAAQGAPELKAARAKVEKNPKDAEALNDYGFALRQNGKLDEAEKYLKQAIAAKSGMGEAHINLSVVYYDQGKFKESLDEAQKGVKIDANNAIFRVVLGNAYSKTGDLKAAAQEYKVAIQLKPDYENAHYNLGRVQNEDGQTSEAKLSLAKALELDPNDDRVIMLLDKLQGNDTAAPSTDATTGGAAKKTSKKS